MSKYSGLFAVALGTLVLGSTLVVSACGSAPPLPAYAMPPSNDVKTLTFFLSQPRPGDNIIESAEEAIQSALIRAEYKITTDESEPHDGVIELEISASEKPATFVTFELNGQKQKDYAVHVSLSVKEGSSIVDQKVYEYTASNGVSEAGNGFALVNDLSSSMRFRDWAKKTVAKSAPPPKGSGAATAVAGNTKPTATAKPTATTPPAPTNTTPAGGLGTPANTSTSGSAAGAASAKGGAARDQLGGSGTAAPPPSATASGPKPGGGTSPF